MESIQIRGGYVTDLDREQRRAVLQLSRPSTARGLALVLKDLALLALGVGVAFNADSILLALVGSYVAGSSAGALVVLGHDAAHGGLVGPRWLNALAARIAFLPTLHNTTLWIREHHGDHHTRPNVRGLNAWGPMTLDEYRAAPLWRRAFERASRCGVGFALHYLAYRWWPLLFVPFRRLGLSDDRARRAAWLDFTLLVAFAMIAAAVVALFAASTGRDVALALLLVVVVPFLVAQTLVGMTLYLQHTHRTVLWFRDLDHLDTRAVAQCEITVDWRPPLWWDLVSNDTMYHLAHHLLPGLPCYRGKAAQRVLDEREPERFARIRMTPAELVRTFAGCKLYDFESHRWLDWRGAPTFEPRATANAQGISIAP